MLYLLRIGGFNILLDYESKFPESAMIISSIQNIKKSIIDCGSNIAAREISYQHDMLRLCETCQIALEREKHIAISNPMFLASSMNERVDRILDFMNVYPMKYRLQCQAFDALYLFVKKRSIPDIASSPKLLPTIGKILLEYIQTKPGIIWRASVVLQVVASLSCELARHVVLLQIHEQLCQAFPRLERRPQIQQIILRLIGELAKWRGKDESSPALLRSNVCMSLLQSIEAKVTGARELVRGADVSTRNEVLTAYSVVLPHELRKLLKEYKGGYSVYMPVEEQPLLDQHERRDAIQQIIHLKPIYGTTTTKYYTAGERGLL